MTKKILIIGQDLEERFSRASKDSLQRKFSDSEIFYAGGIASAGSKIEEWRKRGAKPDLVLFPQNGLSDQNVGLTNIFKQKAPKNMAAVFIYAAHTDLPQERTVNTRWGGISVIDEVEIFALAGSPYARKHATTSELREYVDEKLTPPSAQAAGTLRV